MLVLEIFSIPLTIRVAVVSDLGMLLWRWRWCDLNCQSTIAHFVLWMWSELFHSFHLTLSPRLFSTIQCIRLLTDDRWALRIRIHRVQKSRHQKCPKREQGIRHKVLSYAALVQLGKETTLKLWGQHYRDVLAAPEDLTMPTFVTTRCLDGKLFHIKNNPGEGDWDAYAESWIQLFIGVYEWISICRDVVVSYFISVF